MATILIVDDDARIVDIGLYFARARGHEPIGAGTTGGAIEIVETRHVDVAILDFKLPDGNGVALFSELRRRQPAIVGVIITGYAAEAGFLSGRAGVAKLIEKPIHYAMLLNCVEGLLDIQAPQDDVAAQTPLQEQNREGFVPHAARRISDLIVRARQEPNDFRTLDSWAAVSATSAGALRAWCRAANIHPRSALRFARGLRAHQLSCQFNVPPASLLDISDPRTLAAFLRDGHFSSDSERYKRSTTDFCRTQTYCTDRLIKEQVVEILVRKGLRREQ